MQTVELLSRYIPKQFLNKNLDSSALHLSSGESSDDEEQNDKREETLFFIDKKPDVEPADVLEEKEERVVQDDNKRKKKAKQKHPHKIKEKLVLSSEIQPGIDTSCSYIEMKAGSKPHLSVPKLTPPELQHLLAKSVIKPDFEKCSSVPEYREGLRQRKRDRMAEKAKTKGSDWFDMPAKELTDELKNDLEVIQMRRALDRKTFYKRSDPLPKYFQVGTVLDSPADFYHSRVPKKERKRTLVEELLADAEFRKYGKKKYSEILSKHPRWKNKPKKRKN